MKTNILPFRLSSFSSVRRRVVGLVRLVLICSLLPAFPSKASILVSCAGLPGGDLYDRGFYLPQYPGVSLESARLKFSALVAGSYTVRLAVRSNAFNGPLIGAATNTFTLSGSSTENQPVTFTFPGVPVTKDSRVCFAATIVSGPSSSLYYSVPNFTGGCPQVIQTEDTTPPLSTFRRNGLDLVVTGRFEVGQMVSCTNRVSGDSYTRGFYVPQYRGVTLESARLELSATVAGTYQMRLTVRSNTYDGVILATNTQTIALNGSTAQNLPVTFVFPSAPVVKYSRLCFDLSLVSGPATTVFYAIPGFTGGCTDVVQTEGKTPPLDTFRRFGVSLVLTGQNDPASGIHLEISRQPPNVLIKWNSAAGQNYTLESADALPTFSPLATGILATPPTNSSLQSLSPGVTHRLYRVRMNPPIVP